MYYLQNNVEIVSGAKQHCIYNLNTGKLYHLDSDDLALIHKVLDGSIPDSGDTQVFVQYLLSEGILTQPNSFLPPIAPIQYGFSADFVWLEVTQNCNLLCRHCYEGSSRAERRPEMAMEHFVRTVDIMKTMNVGHVQLVGGEPLMHSQIKQLIEYAANAFDHVEIFTNGTLLTNELLDIIKGCGASLAFSLYAAEPSVHERVTRTSGSFALTYQRIKDAISKGLEVRVASVEMKDIPEFPLDDLIVNRRTDFPRLTGRADLSLYNRDMLRRKLITKENFKYPIDPDTYYKNKSRHNCFGERLYVDCNLNVFPCAMERRVCYGNLLSEPIEKILHNCLAKMNKDKIVGCKDCEYRYACYDCRCDANNAPIDAKPWYCTYKQDVGEWEDVEKFIDSLIRPDAL